MVDRIYAIQVFEKIEEDTKTGFPDFGCENLVGYFFSKEQAFSAMKENRGDIWETCYDYAVIEEIKEGLYQSASKEERWFFMFSKETKQYEPIKEPEFLAHFSGFTIG